MAAWSEVARIALVETEGSQAEIQFGVSTLPSTAWAYAPSNTAAGGDVWLGTATYNAAPELGNYAWMTILHELGHALGLAHPHEASTAGRFAATWADETSDGLCPCCAGALHGQQPTLAGAKSVQASATDAMPFSVMSYRSYSGADVAGGYKNAADSYAQSPMLRDIAAMQHLYGANYETRAEDTVYRWSETTGEKFVNGTAQGKPIGNKIFETIWDGNGNDTFDLSNFKNGLTVDLRPGQWSDFGSGQLARLGSAQTAPGNVAVAYLHDNDVRSLIENVLGGSGNDQITGNEGDNILVGGGGNDTLFGLEGRNILVGDYLGSELGLVGLAAPASLQNRKDSGVPGNDTLVGGNGNDILAPGNGTDLVYGGEGMDTLLIDIEFASLSIEETASGFLFIHAGGRIEAVDVELLAVRGGIYSLVGDVALSDQRVEDLALLYQASLGRETDPAGLNFWLGRVQETGLLSMAQSLLNSVEFADRFGQQQDLDSTDFVSVLYANVLGREAGAEEIGFWVGELAANKSRADVLLQFSQSEENRANVQDAGHPVAGSIDIVQVSHAQWAEHWI